MQVFVRDHSTMIRRVLGSFLIELPLAQRETYQGDGDNG
jgi:hypothetical protein